MLSVSAPGAGSVFLCWEAAICFAEVNGKNGLAKEEEEEAHDSAGCVFFFFLTSGLGEALYEEDAELQERDAARQEASLIR